MKQSNRLERLYVHPEFKKRMKIESARNGFNSISEYSKELALRSDTLYDVMDEYRRKRKRGFDFP